MGKNEEIKKLLSEEQLKKVAGGTAKQYFFVRCEICMLGVSWASEQRKDEFITEHTNKTGHNSYDIHSEWRG